MDRQMSAPAPFPPPDFRPGRSAEMRTQHFAGIVAWWNTARGTRAMPARADFLPEDLAPWWRYMNLLAVEPLNGDGTGHRYRYVYSGLKPMEYNGGDFTGRTIDEALPPRMYAPANAVYRACIARRKPLYTLRHAAGKTGFPVVFEWLLLPLAADGRNVDMFISLLERHGSETAADPQQSGSPDQILNFDEFFAIELND
jgi:hypothetical protein